MFKPREIARTTGLAVLLLGAACAVFVGTVSPFQDSLLQTLRAEGLGLVESGVFGSFRYLTFSGSDFETRKLDNNSCLI
jgi:hypothetical protein